MCGHLSGHLRPCFRGHLPIRVALALCLTHLLATASTAQETAAQQTATQQTPRLVFAAGKVELSPVSAWTGKRPLSLATEQLVGTGDDGWAVLATPRSACADASGRIWPKVEERWLIGPGTIHTVGSGRSECKVSSERRLQQIFANLGDCASACQHSVTVVVGGDAAEASVGLATETLFNRLLGASKLATVRPRHVDALPLEAAAVVRAADLCQRYADSALAQQMENESKGCGLAGSGWSDDGQEHLQWCRQGDNRQVKNLERRRASRRRILDQCRPRATSPECAELAAAAAALQDDNLWFGCGLGGTAWNADYRVHYDRCTSGGQLDHLPALVEQQRQALSACQQR